MGAIWVSVISSSFVWLYLLPTFTPVMPNAVIPVLLLVSLSAAGVFFQIDSHYDGTLNNLTVKVALSLFLTFSVLMLQALVTPLIYIFLSRFHEVGFLNTPAFPLIKLFGLQASISEGVIYIPAFKNLLAFPGLLEKFNLYLVFYIFVSGTLLLVLFQPSLKTWLTFSGILFFYAYLRYVMMIFIYAQVDDAVIYWNPLVSTVSFCPLILLLWWKIPVQKMDIGRIPLRSITHCAGRYHRRLLFLFVSFFLLSGLFFFHDPGMKKKGRVLIDEKHSNWEWSTRKFDTTWYGRKSTYNYYCMADYLNHHYSVSQNQDKELTPEFLSGYDILILKTPTQPYSEEESNAIVQFVENGGGLWLIGDHTNVFGMSYYMNFLAKRFGMFFHYDSTYDLKTGKLSRYTPPLLPHPIVNYMPPFLFATSCTLSAPLWAENVMIGYGLRTRLLSYSGRSFFHQDPTTDYEFGLFLQSAAVKYGRGRVAAFTDSTCFSNFYMFIPGKPELLLGTVEWLNRINHAPALKYALWLFSFFALCFSGRRVLFIKRDGDGIEGRRRYYLLMAVSAVTGFTLGLFMCGHLNRINYSPPSARSSYKTIAFESEHSDLVLPVERLVDKEPNNYHTFFVWTQRVDHVPSFDDFEQAFSSQKDMVVIINPVIPFSDAELFAIEAYIKSGGKLLVMDDPDNKASTSNQLLQRFEMQIEFGGIENSDLLNSSPSPSMKFKIERAGAVTGGKGILKSRNKKNYFSVKSYSGGFIGVMGDSSLFANKNMGSTQTLPNQNQKNIYNLEFFILKFMENLR